MALKTLYVTGVPGQTYIQHPALVFVEMVLCLREGKMLVPTDSTPTGKYCRHLDNEGKVELDADTPVLTMTPEPTPTTRFRPMPEEFIVLYKTN